MLVVTGKTRGHTGQLEPTSSKEGTVLLSSVAAPLGVVGHHNIMTNPNGFGWCWAQSGAGLSDPCESLLIGHILWFYSIPKAEQSAAPSAKTLADLSHVISLFLQICLNLATGPQITDWWRTDMQHNHSSFLQLWNKAGILPLGEKEVKKKWGKSHAHNTPDI